MMFAYQVQHRFSVSAVDRDPIMCHRRNLLDQDGCTFAGVPEEVGRSRKISAVVNFRRGTSGLLRRGGKG
jgi:hypothetical protein